MSTSEQQGMDAVAETTKSFSAELYLIQNRRNRYLLYVPPRTLKACESAEGDHIRKFMRGMARHRNKVIRWLGRVMRVAHYYYLKLEDGIDPLERMIKAINYPDQLSVRHSPHTSPNSPFRALLRRQKLKHLVWLFVDGSITLVVVMLAPILVPIPGPNVFFYYPALRLASHYRAMMGARRVLNRTLVTFNGLPALGDLEENLWIVENRSDLSGATREPDIEGLREFLERMG